MPIATSKMQCGGSRHAGQRVMVFVSPGFILSQLFTEVSGIIDRATRANIVIDTIDVRGLYTPDAGETSQTAAWLVPCRRTQDDVTARQRSLLSQKFSPIRRRTAALLSHRNDLDEGLRAGGGGAPVSYVLGFCPKI